MKFNSKLIIFTITLFVLTASANAQSPPEELLKQMVGQLQTTPNDNALREKIIKLGAEIKPAPAIPEEANRSFVKGNVFKEAAKDAAGYELAIAAYKEAQRTAPWWGDAYYNQAVTLGLAEKFDVAIASFKLYIASVPVGSAEARDAQNKIYALEAKAEIATVKKAEDGVEARKKAEKDATAAEEKRFEGTWWKSEKGGTGDWHMIRIYVRHQSGDNWSISGSFDGGKEYPYPAREIKVAGPELRFYHEQNGDPECGTYKVLGTVSTDGLGLSLDYKLMPLDPNRPLRCPLPEYYGSYVAKYTKE